MLAAYAFQLHFRQFYHLSKVNRNLAKCYENYLSHRRIKFASPHLWYFPDSFIAVLRRPAQPLPQRLLITHKMLGGWDEIWIQESKGILCLNCRRMIIHPSEMIGWIVFLLLNIMTVYIYLFYDELFCEISDSRTFKFLP